jgi:hypothetical protein
MNELIEEFYKQSFIEVQDENSFPCMTFSKQKFAELIIRECAGIAQNYMSRWPEDHPLTTQIKQHFGVEE